MIEDVTAGRGLARGTDGRHGAEDHGSQLPGPSLGVSHRCTCLVSMCFASAESDAFGRSISRSRAEGPRVGSQTALPPELVKRIEVKIQSIQAASPKS